MNFIPKIPINIARTLGENEPSRTTNTTKRMNEWYTLDVVHYNLRCFNRKFKFRGTRSPTSTLRWLCWHSSLTYFFFVSLDWNGDVQMGKKWADKWIKSTIVQTFRANEMLFRLKNAEYSANGVCTGTPSAGRTQHRLIGSCVDRINF